MLDGKLIFTEANLLRESLFAVSAWALQAAPFHSPDIEHLIVILIGIKA